MQSYMRIHILLLDFLRVMENEKLILFSETLNKNLRPKYCF